ncbi:SH3 domain-containing protein [Butyrivibrio sp. MC2013]|uniref:SH3 domain-containing protein n=1 Tax=Butyrivibrio sp. MC2013 TaxID=1280686 RepID=UPI0003FD17A1|nr:SH3 domain-containing protein [Butyrivibrio sp. MC2013]
MADKIYNINDYKKNPGQGPNAQDPYENSSDTTAEASSEKVSEKIALDLGYTRPEDISADDIQIEDPLNFLSAKEKEQYILAHSDTLLNSHSSEDIEKESSAASTDQNNNAPYYQGAGPINAGAMPQDSNLGNGFGAPYYGQVNGGYEEPHPYNNASSYQGGDYYNNGDDYSYQDIADLEELEEEEDDYSPVLYYLPRILAVVAGLFAAFIIFMFAKKLIPSMIPADQETADNITGEDTLGDEDEEVDESVPQGSIVHTTSGLNLRTSPEKADNIGQTVKSGTELILVGEENGWAKVWYDGQYYYCSKSYIQ